MYKIPTSPDVIFKLFGQIDISTLILRFALQYQKFTTYLAPPVFLVSRDLRPKHRQNAISTC